MRPALGGRIAVMIAVSLAALAVLPVSWAVPGAAGSARARPTCLERDTIAEGTAQTAATARYWTVGRMQAAAGWSRPGAGPAARRVAAQAPGLSPVRPSRRPAPAAVRPQRLTVTQVQECIAARPQAATTAPSAVPQSHFAARGYKTVGKLFFVSCGPARGRCRDTSCTGTSIRGPSRRNVGLVLTAAHCVAQYNPRSSHGWEFVPDWHLRGRHAPYGIWTGSRINLLGWFRRCDLRVGICRRNPRYDYALVVIRPHGRRSLGSRVGADGWAVNRARSARVTIVGYPSRKKEALVTQVLSRTIGTGGYWSRKARTHRFTDGTSGGPWFLRYQPKTQSGTLIGDIGGFQEGGKYASPSYSPYWTAVFRALVDNAP
jgi:hypothetical protein